MIKEVTMYTVVCDCCGKDNGADSEYSCWNDENYAEITACEDGEWRKEGDKHYCSDCFYWDENDELCYGKKPETSTS